MHFHIYTLLHFDNNKLDITKFTLEKTLVNTRQSTRRLLSKKDRTRLKILNVQRAQFLGKLLSQFSLGVDEIKSKFDHLQRKLYLRRDFENRKWKNSESFGDYFHDKLILGNLVPIPEDESIDYLI